MITAVMDLKAVQLIRGAMAAADGQGGAGGMGAAARPVDRFEPRKVIHPTPRIEPRRVFHPTPRYEARPVLHPMPRVEPVEVPAEPTKPTSCISPATPPPWAEPTWKHPVEPAPTVKINQYHTDIQNKGSLLDLFC